jgi:urea carboxylase-associated protein 2
MSHDTSNPAGARAHARSMAGTVVPSMPTVPASAARDLPAGVAAASVLWDETLGAGAYAVRRLPRGARLRITNQDGDACAGFCVWNAELPSERLNVADTVKVQWNAYLGAGSLLLSRMGRSLMAILEDTSGHHDTFCGTTTAAGNARRYGSGGAHGLHPSGRDRFLVGLAKHGLDRRDLPANVNFFAGVRADPDGKLSLTRRDSVPGEHVLLRADLDALVAIVNVPHVLDDRPGYFCGRLRLTAWLGEPAGAGDPIRLATPERERAYENVDDWLLGRGGAAR